MKIELKKRKLYSCLTKEISILMFISILIMMCLLFNGCGKMKGYKLLDKNECHEPFIVSEVYWENYSNSAMAFETVIVHFTQSDGEYTDDFGGSFVDNNGIYNVCVIGSYRPLTSDYLIFKQVENSLKLLNSIYDDIIKFMDKYGIWSVEICEVCNKVKICIEKENKIGLVVGKLKNDGLFKKNTLLFYVDQQLYIPNYFTN